MTGNNSFRSVLTALSMICIALSFLYVANGLQTHPLAARRTLALNAGLLGWPSSWGSSKPSKAALRASKALNKKVGIIIVDHGSRRETANKMLIDVRVRMYV